ncbi:MAG: hypothetical protein COS35_03190 [Zetaproteobacteria bacterium CG02_land_8_20_14_3_00_50_9]|nr:MAG: hypothetical protein COS35_03190 [Zetaproteobacteria bacterium CG02_land_8_20_14_3_00_50_9]
MQTLDKDEVLRSLVKIGSEVTPLTDKLQRMLVVVLSHKDIDSLGKGHIALADKKGAMLTMVASYGLDEALQERCQHIEKGSCLCGKVLANQQAIFKSCLDKDHDVVIPEMCDHGHYVMPILAGERMAGVFSIEVASGCKKNIYMMKIFESCVLLIGMVIHNHDQWESIRQSNQLLERRVKDATAEISRTARMSQENPNPIMSIRAKSMTFSYINPIAQLLLGYMGYHESVQRIPDVMQNSCEQVLKTRQKMDIRVDVAQLTYEFVFLPDERSEAVLVFGNNVTELLSAEREKRLLQTKNAHSQRLRSLGAVAGGVAHRFNNLLMTIMGNSDLLKLTYQDESEAAVMLDKIQHACVQASSLCQQMQAYAGKGKASVSHFDLSDKIRHIEGLLDVMLSKNTALRFDLEEEPTSIKADPLQIQQVLINLVQNASEAIGDNQGTVSVRTALKNADAAYLKYLHAEIHVKPGKYVVLEVADNGSGMSPAEKEQMFDPFFTTKFIGRGLGLSVVEGIVHSHGGAIHVVSEEGKGTLVKILFPLVSLHQVEVADAGPDNEPEIHFKKVLIIDDDPAVRELIGNMLGYFGYTTMLAENGLTGVNMYRQHRAEIGLAVVDLNMPEMDGRAVLKALRELEMDLPVVISSGYSEEQSLSEIDDERVSFLGKPFKAERLRDVVSQALAAV